MDQWINDSDTETNHAMIAIPKHGTGVLETLTACDYLLDFKGMLV